MSSSTAATTTSSPCRASLSRIQNARKKWEEHRSRKLELLTENEDDNVSNDAPSKSKESLSNKEEEKTTEVPSTAVNRRDIIKANRSKKGSTKGNTQQQTSTPNPFANINFAATTTAKPTFSFSLNNTDTTTSSKDTTKPSFSFANTSINNGDTKKDITSSTNKDETKTSNNSSSPPMSTSAPKPLGFNKEESKVSEKKKTSEVAGAAFPPMSKAAPKPFSSTKPTTSSNNSAAAFPPMSKAAPKPFGAATKKDESKTTSSNSAAFPPMSKAAPSPFSSFSRKDENNKSSSEKGSAAFPPISMQNIPKPFSMSRPLGDKSNSSAFPPMSNAAPKPFGQSSEPDSLTPLH